MNANDVILLWQIIVLILLSLLFLLCYLFIKLLTDYNNVVHSRNLILSDSNKKLEKLIAIEKQIKELKNGQRDL